MKRVHFWFLGLMIMLAGCFSISESTVTVALGDVDDATAPIVVFGFADDLCADTLVGMVDTNLLVVFEPELKGKCMWLTKRSLAFYASEPLPPATTYKATFQKSIAAFAPEASHPSSVVFTTPPLSITSTMAWFTANTSATVKQPVIELSFNYMMTTSTIKSFLKFSAASSEIPFALMGDANSKTIRIKLLDQLPASNVTCELKSGASSSVGGKPTDTPQEIDVSFPEPNIFEVVNVTTSYQSGEGLVQIITSEPPDAATIAGNISVEPFVIFHAETTPNGLLLKGNFAEGTNYSISISQHVRTVFGNNASYDLELNANFGSPTPSVSFAESEAFYLGSEGNRNLGLYVRNTKEITLKIFRIFENNMLHYLRNGKKYDWGEDDGTWYENYEYALDEDYGSLIFSQKILTNSLATNGQMRLINLDGNLFHGKGKATGLYIVRVESTEKPWIRDVRLLSFSDIGLLAMVNRDELLVQVFSINTAEPIEGASVSLVSRNNQEIAKGQTGAGGLWVISNFAATKGKFEPAMITARLNTDFNCMVFSDNMVETSRFDAGGRFLPDGPYDAFVYGERNLYRPGDSVHFALIVRDQSWQAPGALPLLLKVTDASGREFFNRQKKTGANGETELSFRVPASAMTGSWALQVSSTDGTLLNRTGFLVEEFQPDRLSVQLTTQKQRYLLTDKVEATIAAASLIGPPAVGCRFELEYRLSHSSPVSKQFSDFNFKLSSEELTAQQVVTDEGITGSDGRAVKKFEFPALQGTGLWRGSIIGTVFDENERPVIRETGFLVATQKAFVGVNNSNNWVSVRAPHNFSVTSIDAQGNFLPDVNIEVDVARVAWETVIERQNGQNRYKSQRHEIHVLSNQLLVRSKNQQWAFSPPVSGQYLVRFRVAGTNLWVSEWIYAYGSGSVSGSSFGVSREGEIKLQADKESYKPGEEAKILIQTPFDGVLSIITGQGNGRFSHQLVTAENRAASVDIVITPEMKPNIFITATLMRKANAADLPLTVAHGLISLNVVDQSTVLPLTISAAERSKSRTMQKVVIQTAPGSTVTLASVDEGILQLTNHITPDPWTWFYGRRAFTAKWYDIYAKLYPEIAASFSSTGGDGAVDMSRRINPFGNKKAKSAVWWSGLRQADANGRCTFSIPLPAFSGKLRLMAVAFKGEAMASAQKFMVVADPLVITAGVPQFLSPGDKLFFPVNLMNTTSKPMHVTVAVSAKGTLKINSGETNSITLQPNVQQRVMSSIVATQGMGEGIVLVKAEVDKTVYQEQFEVAVRPAAGPIRMAGSGVIEGGRSASINAEIDLLAGSASSKIWLSRNPIGEFAPLLNDLIQYPYGCLEQTTSAAFPQLYLGISGDVAFVGSQAASNINEAIRKISAMQLWDGSFSYWLGGADGSWWASAYATHFLIEAGKAGYDVNNKVLASAIRWLHQQTTRYETATYSYFNNKGEVYRLLQARRETAYSLFVLSLAGQPNIPALNYYKEKRDLLTIDSRVVMASACKLAGDGSGFGLLMPGNVSMPLPVRTDGGSFYSNTSSIGWAMNALLSAVPDDNSMMQYLSALLTSLKSKEWMSTFDKSQALCALSRLYRKSVASSVTATISPATGKDINFDGTELVVNQKTELFPARIATKQTGKLYYSWSTEGIGTGHVSSSDHVLMVRRTLLDRLGRPISGPVRIGQLVVVRIGLQTNLPMSLENVAVSDLLPACFEIENPRLAPGRDYAWMNNRSEPDQVDVRNDRINFFTRADSNPKFFYYLVRVTAAGEFTSGSTSAEAMYNGQFYSVVAGSPLISLLK